MQMVSKTTCAPFRAPAQSGYRASASRQDCAAEGMHESFTMTHVTFHAWITGLLLSTVVFQTEQAIGRSSLVA